MLFILNEQTDPYFNLAAEEYLVKNCSEEVFMLWRNEKTIVVGRNQNTLAEINQDYIENEGIRVVRRMSGGGAVYHDLGNVNFTFILNSDKDFGNYEKFTAPVISFLQTLGVDAVLSGRNDLLIGDKKISGNAQYMYKNRILHHGTLLFSTEGNHLGEALRVSEEKIRSKGIQSVRSRVTNIASHLKVPLSVTEFMNGLRQYMLLHMPDCQAYDLSRDSEAIRRLREEKYATWEWNFGYSPKYSFHRKARFSFGEVEVSMEINNKSLIESVLIFGDFFSRKPVSELGELLEGKSHRREALEEALKHVVVSDYIQGMEQRELLSLLF